MIAFSKGTQGSSEQVGTIPADYSQGSGTLATGTTADKATEAALAAAHGGELTVDTRPGHGAAFHLRLPQPEAFQVTATESQGQLP